MGWELRYFFSPSISNVVEDKLLSLLKESSSFKNGEQRTDIYLQLNHPNIGVKFRGDIENNKGYLEYKIRTETKKSGSERWSKKSIGMVQKSEDEIKHSVISSIKEIKKLPNFNLSQDLIYCDKLRKKIILQDYSVLGLSNIGKSVILEVAKLKIRNESNESIGNFFSFNLEGAGPKYLKPVGEKIIEILNVNENDYYCNGYPEFLIKITKNTIK